MSLNFQRQKLCGMAWQPHTEAGWIRYKSTTCINKQTRENKDKVPYKIYGTNYKSFWMAIDRKQPNPMKFPEDITTFNRLKQEERLYQFLTGVDDKFDTVRRDLLKQEPAPSVESAYATIRREAARLQILKPTTDGVGEASQGEIGTGLAAKNRTD
ncbi:hypothetical protein HN51_018119 [Arachis hypogaea]